MAGKTGRLYGVGVGPGDPELLTLKAQRLIKQSGVIAYPTNKQGKSLARDIATIAIAPGAAELPIYIPMTRERAPAQETYDKAARDIAAYLDDGLDVAFLCEGDPFFYGSFMYLFKRLNSIHQVEVVPGITSLTACAAAFNQPIAARDDLLTVLPATLPEEVLRARLAETDAAAIIKIGSHFEKVCRVLRALNLTDKAGIVEHATSPSQRVTRLSDMPPGERPYFSTIMIYQGGETW